MSGRSSLDPNGWMRKHEFHTTHNDYDDDDDEMDDYDYEYCPYPFSRPLRSPLIAKWTNGSIHLKRESSDTKTRRQTNARSDGQTAERMSGKADTRAHMHTGRQPAK